MQLSYDTDYFWKGREGNGREGKGREGKGKEGKAREGDRQRIIFNLFLESVLSYISFRKTLRITSNFERPGLFTGSTDFHFSFTDMKF